jgi:hypothetical protein
MSGDLEHKYFADGMVGRHHRRAVAVQFVIARKPSFTYCCANRALGGFPGLDFSVAANHPS